MKLKQEVKIGIVVSVIIFLFLWGYNYIKGRNIFSSYNYYHATFSDIYGLQKSATVTVNGYAVGLVSDIQPSEKLDSIRVEVGIRKTFIIPDNSVIEISGILPGSKAVTLYLGDSKRVAENNDALPGRVGEDIMDFFKNKIKPIADNADHVIVSIDSVLQMLTNTFNSETQADIQHIIKSIDELISAERRKIGFILSNFESISSNLKQSNEDISQMIANLNALSDSLANSDIKLAVTNANKSLAQMNILLEGINRGEGTIGQLTRNDSLYIYLQRTMDDLDKLLIDLRENPRDYVHFSLFGKKSKK